VTKPPRRGTRHPGLLSLNLPSVQAVMAKVRGVNRHIAWHTSPRQWSRSVRWLPGWMGWLVEISTNLREAV